MPEDRILELYLLAQDNISSLLQWWLSISIGLVALAHFAVRKLNLVIVALVASHGVRPIGARARTIYSTGTRRAGAKTPRFD